MVWGRRARSLDARSARSCDLLSSLASSQMGSRVQAPRASLWDKVPCAAQRTRAAVLNSLISFPNSVLVHRSDPGPEVPLSLQVRGAEGEGHFLRQEKSVATAFPVPGTKKGEKRWIPASWSFPGLPLLPKAGVKGRSPPRPAPYP